LTRLVPTAGALLFRACCSAGSTRPRGSDVGEFRSGHPSCEANGQRGECIGAVAPGALIFFDTESVASSAVAADEVYFIRSCP